MTQESTTPRVALAGYSLTALLLPVPVVCFIGALVTDITYANSALIQWADFSAWLLAVGVAVGVIAFLFALIDRVTGGRDGRSFLGWGQLAVAATLLIVALFNNFVHARDGWTSVVPTGLTLSVVTVALIVVASLLGHLMRTRTIAEDAR